MAAGTPQKPPNRTVYGSTGGNVRGGMDMVGADALLELAREDARWFRTIIIVVCIVLFLALPLVVLIAIDYKKDKAEWQAERRAEKAELKRLKKELESNVKD